MPLTEVPQTKCPKCGAWQDDYDGFGVLAHGKCGYCCHPSSTNGVCNICGEVHGMNPAKTPLEKGDTVRFKGGLHPVVETHETNAFVKIDFNGSRKWLPRMAVDFVRRTPVYDAFRKMK